MNKQEKKKERANSYVIFALNDEFSNFNFALFEMFFQTMKELLQNFFLKLVFAKTFK